MRRAVSWGLLCLGLAAVLAGGIAVWPTGNAGAGSRRSEIVFQGFSTLEDAFAGAIFPAFQAHWRAERGEEVRFVTSFGSVGKITSDILQGVPADMAVLHMDIGVRQLVEAGVVPPDVCARLPRGGTLIRTPIVIVVRPGNPLGIRDFKDLGRPGVLVVHADPTTSGQSYWAVLAEFGAGSRHGGGWTGGRDLLRGIWKNVVAQPKSAREARGVFEGGVGDVLITSEQDAIWGRTTGTLQAEIVYPRSTIVSEANLMVISKNVEEAERPAVNALIDFFWSERCQRILVEHGFRSSNEGLNEAQGSFGIIEDLFRIDDLGGWKKVRREVIDGIWKQVLAETRRG
jgi:sulfate/thiosulfate transport system substrate-binding protein